MYILPLYFDTCFYFQLIADTELNVKNGAEVLDRLLKVETYAYTMNIYIDVLFIKY